MSSEGSSSYVPGAISSLFGLGSSSKVVTNTSEQSNDALFGTTQSTLKAVVRKREVEGEKQPSGKTEKSKKTAGKPEKETKRKKIVEKQNEKDDSISESESEAVADSDKDSQPDDEKDERTVFIGNVPVKAFLAEDEGGKTGVALKKLEKALRKTFSEYGKVESVRLRSLGLKSVKVPSGSDFHLVRKVAVAKGSLDDRLDTCNAFIVFETTEEANTAAEKANSSIFYGNHIRVDLVRRNSKGVVFERKCTVFVGNLVFEASEEECRTHFAKAIGDEGVKSVRIVRDPTTNLGRGFAYVLLDSPERVTKAIKVLNDTKIRDRAIRVTNCERSSKKKDAKLALKRKETSENEKKSKRSFAGKEASDPKENALPESRRKRARLAQKAASKNFKPKGSKRDDGKNIKRKHSKKDNA